MADIVDTDKPDKTPLLKEKKPRPPQSEKQMANFKIMQEKRAKKVEDTKQEKILTAQRALLVKEGYVKKPIVATQPIQFEIEDESEQEQEPEPIIKKPKQKQIIKEKAIIATPKVKPIKKLKPRIPEPDSESDMDSDSSEEIIVIKRKSKKAKGRKVVIEEDDVEEDETPSTPMNYMNYFC